MSTNAPKTLPKISSGPFSNIVLALRIPGLSESFVLNISGIGTTPLGPNASGATSASVVSAVFSSDVSLKPTIAVSAIPFASNVAPNLLNQGVVNAFVACGNNLPAA